MQTRSSDEFRALMRHTAKPCLSLLLPCDPSDTQPLIIQLHNYLREAERQLLAHGLDAAPIRDLLAPVAHFDPTPSGGHVQAQGLAIFLAPAFFRSYQLPYPVAELLVIANHFHLKPLLPLWHTNGRFYVLALSRDHVRLLHGDRAHVEELPLRNMPTSMAETLASDDFARERAFRQGSGVAARGATQETLRDRVKEETLRYCQQVNQGLHAYLRDERAPLVLAGVTSILAIYRQANTYPHLVSHALTGAPDHLSAITLHAQAWEIVQPIFLQAQQEAVARYQHLAASAPARVTSNIRKILPSALQGRIETLFVALDRQRWGTYDAASSAIELHDEQALNNIDLLDLAAVQTMLHGGAAYAVPVEQLPDTELAAAILRY
jgi:hypothetical protein